MVRKSISKNLLNEAKQTDIKILNSLIGRVVKFNDDSFKNSLGIIESVGEKSIYIVNIFNPSSKKYILEKVYLWEMTFPITPLGKMIKEDYLSYYKQGNMPYLSENLNEIL